MGVRSWFRRWLGRRPARTITRRPLPLALQRLEDRDVPAVVGYYDMGLGQGNSTQLAPIAAAGQTAKLLTDLTAADLAGVDVLFVQNPSNAGYGAEYLGRLAPVQDAVAAGMTLLIQDRYVSGAASILPGGPGIGFARELGSDIDVIDDTTAVTHGPAGAITNTSLDGASYSDHGYATAATLPAGAETVLSTADHTHIVTFSYRYGAGNVIYSSIPLDFYLSTTTNLPAFGSVYAPNVVAYAADLLNVAPTASPGTLTTDEDTPAGGRLVASDADGDTLTYGIVGGPSHGTVAITGPNTGDYTYTPAPNFNGTDSFTFRVADGRGGFATAAVAITVNPVNDPPTVGPLADTTADEGSPVSFSATAGDVDGDTLTYSWAFGDGATAAGPDATHAYDHSGVYTVVLTVADGRGGIATGALTATVRNVAPVVAAGPGGTVNEGSRFAAAGSFADPGTDTWTATVDYGDGSGVQPLAPNPDKSFALDHPYADDGAYTVTIRVDDGDGGVGTATLTVTVLNVAPTANAGPDRTANEGDTVVLNGTYTDPGTADTHTTAWSVADPSGKVVAAGTGPSVTFVPADDGVYTGTFTVTDGDGGSSTATARVTVLNVAPTVAVAGPGSVRPARTASFTAAVGDPGSADASTITWQATNSRGRVVATGTGPRFSFTPRRPGGYTVVCTVTDDDGGVGTAARHLSVVSEGPLPGRAVKPLLFLFTHHDHGRGIGALVRGEPGHHDHDD